MATIKFTSRTPKDLQPTDKVVEYFVENFNRDGDCSLGLRVRDSGKKVWFISYRTKPTSRGQKNNRKRTNIGNFPDLSFSEAKTAAKNKLKEIHEGTDPAAKRQAELDAPTMNDLWDIYLKKHAPSKKQSSIKEDTRMWNVYLKEEIGDRKAADIRRRDIVRLRDDISDTKPVQANRVLALLSTIFNVAIDREEADIEQNPCHRVKKSKEESRTRVLEDGEIRAIWKQFEDPEILQGKLLKLKLLTGQRNIEVCSMRWDDLREVEMEVEDNAGRREYITYAVWTIPKEISKNKRAHDVPLSKQAIALLESIEQRGPYVFHSARSSSGHVEDTKRPFCKCRDNAGLPKDTRGHDLRRTVASKMAEIHVPESTISKVLNHAEGGVTKIYNRYSYLPEKADALQKWADRLDRILGRKETAKVVPIRRAS
ncbi:tyrosine-type recombinase/integrase [Thermodesulfobacteriota bacterium]